MSSDDRSPFRERLRRQAAAPGAQGSAIRALASFAAILRGLRWWLPGRGRSEVGVSLIASRDLHADDALTWQVTGDDPQFRIELVSWPRGWVRLAGIFHSDDAAECTPRLYIDLGRGYRENVVQPLQTDGRPDRFALSFYLPLRARTLRLDPVEHEAIRFRVDELRVRPTAVVWSSFATLRRLARLRRLALNILKQLHWLWPWTGSNLPAFTVALRPSMELRAEAQGAWLATGGDPQFEIDNLPGCPRGWVRLSGRCDAGPSGGLPRLYFDTGRGYDEARSIALHYAADRQQLSADLYLPLRTLSLRLDPLNRPGHFRIDDIAIRRLPAPEQTRRSARATARRLAQPLRPALAWLLPKLGIRRRRDDYAAWLRFMEPGDDSCRPLIARHIESLAYRPRISVVLPTYKTPLRFLREAIASVQAQRYPHWQLCIVDDASNDPALTAFVQQAVDGDPRIRARFSPDNGGIVAASNAALDLADGDYVAFLDHDDLLSELALYYVAVTLNAAPRPEIVYTDEDKIDERGRRFQPHLKPDWNPELLLSNNYIAHLAVYRRGLIEAVGRLTPGTDGSQDYDLMLRCTARCAPAQIRHVPAVLYHWRAIRGSTARAASAKSYTHRAGHRALAAALSGTPNVTIEDGRYPNMYRVRWPLPSPAPRVSIVIPTRDGYAHLAPCLRTLREITEYPDYEVLIVDNQSRDPATLQLFEEEARRPDTQVLRFDAPFNYSAINNMAARAATGSLLLLLNDDIEVIDADWLREMVSWVSRPGIGIVGAKLLYPDQTIQHAGVVVGAGGVAGHAHVGHGAESPGYMGRLWQPQRVSAVTAACLLIRREIYEALEGLDERNLTVAFNDVDLCLRAGDLGWHIVWTPHATLIHHESKSRGSDHAPEKRRRFEREVAYVHARWGDRLLHDPFYHPGFSMLRADYSLAERPEPCWPWLSDFKRPAAD